MAKRGYWFVGFRNRFKRWRVLGWASVSAPLAVLVAALALRDWLSQEDRVWLHLQYLPSVKTYWLYYLIGVLAYFLLVLLFVAPVANQVTVADAIASERERANRRLRRYRERMRRPQDPRPESEDVIAESYITPEEQKLVWAYRNEHGFIIDTDEPNATLRALVVPYKNQRNHPSFRRVGDIDNVSGEISWTSYDEGGFRLNAGPVVWLSEERERLPFRRDSAAHRMVLATLGLTNSQNLCAVQRRNTTLGRQVTETHLVGDRWRVRVALFAPSESKALRRSDVIVERDGHSHWDGCPEGQPYLVGIGSWRNTNRLGLMIQAYGFLDRIRKNEDVNAEYEDWQRTGATFIERDYSEKEKSRFLFEKLGKGPFARLPEQPTTLTDRINRQIAVLERLEGTAKA
jgi:hypothetical protein